MSSIAARYVMLVGQGEPKKHSVRFKHLPQGQETKTFPDVYIPRDVLDVIGATDKSEIYITFEKAVKFGSAIVEKYEEATIQDVEGPSNVG